MNDFNGKCESSDLHDHESFLPMHFIAANKDTLVALPLFADIPYQQLEPFLLQCEYNRLSSQQLLLSPNQENHYLYVIVSGQLSAHIHSHESDKGFRILPGEFVGEVSIVDNQPPTSFVTAMQECIVLCIHETLLWSDFILIPGAARNLLRQITKRSRARNVGIQKSIQQALKLEMLDKELKIAQDLQASMLPQKPLLPDYLNIEIDAFMKAAKEVGGDLYDAFPVDQNRICFAIGDVAGKGIPAALFMVRSITLLRTEMLKTGDLLQAITAMNVSLSQDNPQCMFVTLMICVLNTFTGELQYVNGGHNRPLLGQLGADFRFLDQPKGILVGINPGAKYQLASRQMHPGDLLILYTDGVTEANNPLQEEFSDKRFLDFINQQKSQSMSSLITNIWKAVQDFADGADQSDDLTVVVLRYS